MRAFFKLVIVLLILGAGVAIAVLMIRTRPEARRKPVSVGPPLVETVIVHPRQERVRITAQGEVVPARQVDIHPQVSGQVVWISPQLIPGGRFESGAPLLRIDDRDYQAAVAQRKSELARAVMELKTEKRRQAIARQEWELLAEEVPATPAGRELALRKPQLENARAALESARSALEKARLDVQRTEIHAPFNCFVREKSTETGQYVSPGSKLMTLVGTDRFWVQISVPSDRIPYIRIPGHNAETGAPAQVIEERTDKGVWIRRNGRVTRLLGDLDPSGRMARLLVTVPDPLGLKLPPEQRGMPLLVGAYVRVAILGPMLTDVFVVPRQALRPGERVWTVEQEKLAIQPVTVLWRRKQDAIVQGLEAGARVITSRIATPVEGMKLRLARGGENQGP